MSPHPHPDTQSPKLADCWAKTDPAIGHPALTVRDHCLIVGAVAEAVLEMLPAAMCRLFPEGALTLVAAHDIGKLTPGFQLKCPLWKHFAAVSAATPFRNGLETNHAAVSRSHLQFAEPFIASRKSVSWLASTAGHHGRYPDGLKRIDEPCYEGGNDHFIPLRDELLRYLIAAFGPLPTESAKGESERVHLLTGFTIFADWIGSNTDWFPSDAPADRLAVVRRTGKILSRLGTSAAVAPGLDFGRQFADPASDKTFAPRPIQSALLEAADAPGLYIVEAPMGMGKTEAALATAYKRWTEGDERGLYFALPTQLTSEKIHDRITGFLTNILGRNTIQALIHGNAWLGDHRNRALAPHLSENDPNHPETDHNDTDEALRWFSSTRKQLLAPFGTGTIDQALLAVLPARFAALRYFALAGKVVVIDEVHSYDPYMSALIDRLIRYLLKTGSTVIILSATLTAARRGQLVAAAGSEECEPPNDYPLITKVAAGVITHIPVADPSPPKSVELVHRTLTGDDGAYWQAIADAVTAGANVVVIRNTVALAQETYRSLKSMLTGATADDSVGLIHSRFPQWQRRENEDTWVARLGKVDAARPRGSLLVSTQIVEQSVDIDADLLVTDLAPADLILQRIGRLHRHSRSRPTGFENACCHILHPEVDWQGTAKEIETVLAPHHFIYPPLSLWQSSVHFGPESAITLSGNGIRDILEKSSALRPDDSAGSGMREFLRKSEDEIANQTGTAKTRDVFTTTAIGDKEGTETRYNIQPTAHLILLKSRPLESREGITITPLHGEPIHFSKGYFSYPLAKALHRNAVRIPAYLVREPLKQAPEWLTQHIGGGVLAVLSDNSTELELFPEAPSIYQLHYRSDLGVTQEKIAVETQTTEPEDFWF